jgi:hypothetical protein
MFFSFPSPPKKVVSVFPQGNNAERNNKLKKEWLNLRLIMEMLHHLILQILPAGNSLPNRDYFMTDTKLVSREFCSEILLR